MEKNIPIETPILEGKEYVFCGGRIKVIGPTKNEMLKVATKIEHSNQVTEHAGYKYVGNIIDVQDKYHPDLSDSIIASIIIVVEFENKKLLFTGDSTSENIIKAVDKYYPGDEFEVVKLPHHGSPRNISRELIRRLSTNKFIISTNKALEKVVLFRFAEERKTTELLCNYEWWATGYFTEDDIKKYELKKNDVLFNRTNSPIHVGKTGIYKGEQKAIFAGYLIRINYIAEMIDPDYLCYVMNSEKIRNYGFSVMKKSINQANISGELLKQYRIPVPSMAEQKQIVAEIGKIEREIDEGYSKIESLKALKKKYIKKELFN